MSWEIFFENEKKKGYFKKLLSFLDLEYKTKTIFPPKELVFNAFKLTKEEDIKAVIIGQDPYFHEKEAMGLAFSVPRGVKIPPSLKNIYKEIEIEYGPFSYNSGDLTYLAKQGVFLINSILTVEENKPLSHKNELYDEFFINLMKEIDLLNQPIVFLLWGKEAQKYEKYIKNKNRLILKNSHPSPLGANKGGWFNSSIFIKTNEFLKSKNIKEIDWINKVDSICLFD